MRSKYAYLFLIILTIFSMYAPPQTVAQNMDDYTAYPPFIANSVDPNLLLIIDNSASMYDLAYIDEGTTTRESSYCYDQTYKSTNTYAGYFEKDIVYEYNFTSNRFGTGSFPGTCSHKVTGQICVNITGTPGTVDKFVATGNYLNWLTSSKFDVQKQILTGGKYDTSASEFIAESRGCVGRRFIKEALTSDYVEGGTNTSLGITFGVAGPENPYNASGVSIGGQTHIVIFKGNYDEATCQAAIDLFSDPIAQKQRIIDAIDDCLDNAATNQKQCQFDTRDPKPTCNSDSPDCVIASGTCGIANNGVCGVQTAGTCAVSSAGTCTQYSGWRCTGGSNKTCNGGPLAGASCQNNNACNPQLCSAPASKAGQSCTSNANCDVKACSAPASKVGNSCVVSADCNEKACTAPAANVGNSCATNTDCNSSACSAGPYTGSFCTSNWDCSSNYGHCLQPATSQIKSTFTQSMHSCYQYIYKDQDIGSAEIQQVSNPQGCNQIYSDYKTCLGGSYDGEVCTSDAQCTGGLCKNGPDTIRPGSPVLLCSTAYTGYCASTTNNWATTTWNAREYPSSDDCITAKYEEFCGAFEFPPVIDPSDAPDDTSETANLPAIISDIGIEAQLGSPIADLSVKRYDTTAPTGLIDDYSNSIRFGVMSFNFDGSQYECNLSSSDALSCPKICSITSSRVCTSNVDCPSGETCVSTSTSKDGAKIIHYIGDGNCSITTGNTCVRDDQCPTGETCVATVGDHSTGLIKAIDDVRADTWTPFAEAFYNAVAYFVKDADDNPELDSAKYTPSSDAIQSPLNSGDFAGDKNPIEISCQANNILIISDGTSTADLNSTMKGKVTQSSHYFDDGDAADPSSCGSYSGSSYLDDLSYFANNRNIFNPSDSTASDDDPAQRITTYVVYTGSDTSTATGECAPKTLMQNTAVNGGTTLYNPEDPSALAASLESAFAKISSDRSSGTAVSVLSTTGEGEGAIYQAYFYPSKKDAETGFETRKWLGYIHALYADEYGNIREDTNGNKALDMYDDLIIEMSYDSELGSLANRYNDSNGDGEKDSLHSTVSMGEVASLWKGGDILWSTNPVYRTIYASTTGLNMLDFSSGNASTFKPYLRAADNTEAQNIINWIRGYDFTDSRTGFDFLPYVTDAGHPEGYRQRSLTPAGQSETHVWKLGDIIYSTPSSVGRPMENYDMLYNDVTYYSFFKKYLNRRIVAYVGVNDGMLHALNGGFFSERNHQYCTGAPDSSGNCTSGSYSLGQELWGFIPRGLLPHLKWLTDPAYSHVYYVDLKPKITDVKIFDSSTVHPSGWGTILIGGYRYGGKDISWTSGVSSYSASPEYFALDITEPLNPRLLWTFSAPDLGLSMSYPSVAKVGDKWFAIFGSGPTNYEADSDLTSYQNGNIFVLQLSGGSDGVINTWTENSNFWKMPTGNATAFMASPITVDVDMDFNVDVMYIGESYKQGGSWNGLMHRITTLNGTDSTPPWSLSTLANINNIAGSNDISKKITSAPSTALDDQINLWTYFGTGQFLGLDDRNQTDTGAFYAIKDKCWNGSCSDSYTGLMDVSAAVVKTDESVTGVNACAAATGTGNWSDLVKAANTCDGWAMYFRNLGESTDFLGNTLHHNGERMFTKPMVTGGLVAFGSYVPGTGCDYLGESNAYAVYYKTGTAYSHYLFTEQGDMTSPSAEVARTINLGEGMPSSPSGQKEKDGTVQVFFQNSTGRIIPAENTTPISIKSSLKGWKNEQMQ